MSSVRTGAGYAPTDPQHVATKAYVDSKAGSGGGTTGGVPVYVQQADPALSTSYVWYQTNAAGQVVQVWTNYVAAGGASETWTAANSSPWPSQWTHVNGTSQVANNAGAQYAGSAAYAGARDDLTGMTTQGDTMLVVTVTSSATQSTAIVSIDSDLTGTTNATSNGYYLQVGFSTSGGGYYQVVKVTGGSASGLVYNSKALPAGTAHKVRFQRQGTTLRVRTWQASAAEPSTWDWTGTDTGSQFTGKVSLGMDNDGTTNSTTMTWDDLTVTTS